MIINQFTFTVTISVGGENLADAYNELCQLFTPETTWATQSATDDGEGADIDQDILDKTISREARRHTLPPPFDKLVDDDWNHIHEEAARMRSEYDPVQDAAESPMEHIVTSLGYMDLYPGLEDGEGELIHNGTSLKEENWL